MRTSDFVNRLSRIGSSNISTFMEAAAIGSAYIGNAAIQSAHIQNLAVGTGHIANLAVTNAKIGNLAVTDAKIANAAITTAKIDNAAITTAKIDNAAITTAKIGEAQVDTLRIKGNAVSIPINTSGAPDRQGPLHWEKIGASSLNFFCEHSGRMMVISTIQAGTIGQGWDVVGAQFTIYRGFTTPIYSYQRQIDTGYFSDVFTHMLDVTQGQVYTAELKFYLASHKVVINRWNILVLGVMR